MESMDVTIRQAQPGSPQLPRIVGGRPAAPPEWEAWAEEPGQSLVALVDRQPVAGAHVSLVARAEAWIENLRVHPAFQGRGIARQVVLRAEQVALRYGATVARTAIPLHEYAAQAVAERSGYRPIIQCVVCETIVGSGPLHVPYDAPVEILAGARASEVAHLLDRLPSIHTWERLVPLGWRFRHIVPELVRGLMNDRRLLVAGEMEAAGVFAVRNRTAVISLVDGTPSGIQAIYGTVVEQARNEGVERVVLFAADPQAVATIRSHQWHAHPWCPDGLVVVEKALSAPR